jgi:hypothetical protein
VGGNAIAATAAAAADAAARATPPHNGALLRGRAISIAVVGGLSASQPSGGYIGAGGYSAPMVPGTSVACYLVAQPPSPGAPQQPPSALPVAPASLYHSRALGAPTVAVGAAFGGEHVDGELGRPLWGLKLPVADSF